MSAQVTEQQLQAEMTFRQAIEFPSSPDYILSVHALPDAVRLDSVNATFTPEEATEVLTRLALERDVEALQSYFAESPERTQALGGIYIDHKAGGKVVLQLVQEEQANARITQTLTFLQHPERLQINAVRWCLISTCNSSMK